MPIGSPVSRRAVLATAGVATLGLSADPARAAAPPLPTRRQVVRTARAVNDRWIADHAWPGDRRWANAVYHRGNVAFGALTREPRYLARSRRWAQIHEHELLGGATTRHADNQMAGQVYQQLVALDGHPRRLRQTEASVRAMVRDTETIDDWSWVDALFMAMPTFASVGRRTRDPEVMTQLRRRYLDTRDRRGLWAPELGLWFRDDAAKRETTERGAPVLWSRGNGWALSAHAETLRVRPWIADGWPEFRQTFRASAAAVAAAQGSDGLWRENLADRRQCPWPETSGSALFVHALAYGVRSGTLSRRTYLPVIARAWRGLDRISVRPDGTLGYVQGVGRGPRPSESLGPRDTTDFGVGCFLLAASELARLVS